MGKSFKRRAIKAHEEFLKDPQYRGKVEKHIKVRKREQQEEEAEEAIQDWQWTSDYSVVFDRED